MFFDNRHQHVNRDGDPDLGFERILRSAIELFDSQMLLDPFEEQFHLPTTAIELGDGQRRQGKVVRQKDQPSFLLGIEKADATELVGEASAGNWIAQGYDLIAHDPRGAIDRRRVEPLAIESFARARDKKCRGQMKSVQSAKVEISSVHQVERAGLEGELLEHVDFVNQAVSNDDYRRNIAAQVEQSMEFHRPFALAKLGPGKERKA